MDIILTWNLIIGKGYGLEERRHKNKEIYFYRGVRSKTAGKSSAWCGRSG